jgi:pyruvate/2-oxoglutarate dehydrogenase complex dihydrolipoamide acyltransferase (E2) component
MPQQFPCDVTGLVFDCEAKKLQEIPDGITSNATVVNFSKNDLQQISGNTFSRLNIIFTTRKCLACRMPTSKNKE